MLIWGYRMNKKFWVLMGILIMLIVISSCVGRYYLSANDIFDILVGRCSKPRAITLFYNIRMPRTFLVVISGGALSLSGLVFQSIFKNPIVSPDTLGVANGCSAGAVIAIVLTTGSVLQMQIITFLSGIIVVFAAILLSGFMGRNKLLSLVISGIVMSSLASSVIMLMKYVADPNRHLQAIDFWLMGGFNNASINNLKSIIPIVAVSTFVLYIIRWQMKVLSLGDDEAQTLGVSPGKIRIVAIAMATILVSSVVSVAGVVSWIGLVAPHIIKIYSGDNILETFSLSFLGGGIILLFADILSRTLFPTEIPISILTSFIGALFLFWLLTVRRVIK